MTSHERGPNESGRRRVRWWVIPLAVIALALVLAFLWVFRFRIQRAFEPAPTLPPPPPTAAEAGESAGSEGGGGAGGVLYQTAFDDPAAGEDWELFDDGVVAAQIEDGQLVVAVNAITDQGTWSGLNYTFEDFALDVDAAKLAGPDNNGIIVIFRLVDNKNYNRFDISSDGYYRLIAVRDGAQRVVSGDWASSPAILTGEAANHLRVEAAGDTFRFTVNGKPLRLCVSEDEDTQPIPMEDECLGGEYVMEWTNGDLTRGKIGLGAQGFTGFDGEQVTPAEATIGFDNLVIAEVTE
jgi:hypothetical protein